ncbi:MULTISPECIES: hypothetical protein [unclassified Streptomyces]|uniref:hypothetical protein n=1 Tax=unclassified Streptomyces TaxID=2593676 RepID=UPI001660451A|nr:MULTISPECIES: hypothetical protein [unclassified Streptomyces]MBD0710687.1 hypothetical protein [Streptomyces sp. CBMA291]MBD0715534.1 hypothetical protein [Streptomyces sp. CBMA370]
MNGEQLATAVVEAVARAAVGAAGGVVGDRVVDLVRGRLRSVDRGEEAVAEVERTPDDPDARALLRGKLAAVLAQDPAFAAYLTSVLAPPRPAGPPVNTGSVVIDRGGRARGTFVLGDQTVTRIRKGDPTALAAVVAVVFVLVLAVYGLARIVLGGDDASSGADGRRVAVLKDAATVKAIAPDLHSMPTGWTAESAPAVASGEEACSALEVSLCGGILSTAQSSFRNAFDQSAFFLVVACESPGAAQRFYEKLTRAPSTGRPLSVPALGDQSSALQVSDGKGLAYVQVGTVVVAVEERGSNSDFQVATLEALAKMLAERAQEAQNGHAPAARAQLSG